MSDLPNDSIFAGYRIERVLGVGGMGTVYLGRNPDLPCSEAVKVLSVELSRDPAFRAAAQKLERDRRLTWAQCAGKTISTTANAKTVQQTIGSVESVDDNAKIPT